MKPKAPKKRDPKPQAKSGAVKEDMTFQGLWFEVKFGYNFSCGDPNCVLCNFKG